jgi:hypothetical protein
MPRDSVSSCPSEIPYGGFSPVRLQDSGTARSTGERPAPPGAGLTRPWCAFGYSTAVSRWPKRACRGVSSPIQRTPLSHGSFAQRGLCCPSRHRYYDPIRQSRDHRAPCARALVRPASRPRDLPCFGSPTIPLVPPPMRRSRHHLHSPVASAVSIGLRPYGNRARLLDTPRPASRGKPFRRCNVRSPLRPQSSLAPLTGRTLRP